MNHSILTTSSRSLRGPSSRCSKRPTAGSAGARTLGCAGPDPAGHHDAGDGRLRSADAAEGRSGITQHSGDHHLGCQRPGEHGERHPAWSGGLSAKPFEPTLLRARITSSLEKKRLHDLEQLYRKGLERELDIAREIQQGFLPAELPNVEGWELAAHFQAAREVAGDFYTPRAGGRPPGVLCGRRVRKGVGAALFMTLFRTCCGPRSRPTCWPGQTAPRP